MMWRKEFGYDYTKNMDYLVTAIVILALIGFIMQRSILFMVIGLFVAYLLLNKLYNHTIDKRLELKNPRKSIRLFVDENSVLPVTLENRSIFPMINGHLQFRIDQTVDAFDYVVDHDRHRSQLRIPLSIIGKRKTTIEIPIRATKRGVARIRNIEYTFPHLFHFDHITLKFNPFFYLEFVVFPKPKPIQGIEASFQLTPGAQRSPFSPFEDTQSMLGTRDYQYSDPFHRINWKASVKTQELQTNVYENVVDMSYVFLVNVGTKNSFSWNEVSSDMEDNIAYTAYLCQYLTDKGFPFEIAINARKPGKVPYLHLPEGEGKTHYVHALEMLARIHQQPMMIPFHQMLHRIGHQFLKPKTVVLIGDIPEEAISTLKSWERMQHHIVHIERIGDSAAMKRWGKDAIQHAT
ncbi:DUF58 domain-containing protein [Oceanobacillus halotolerans]|uniref:DUF58 domain-containing protein n=1 Tax=Oceanobacillus halotolerans TaxID=2663380 RepID=UPI0013DB0C8B|nr:DUF58 domain-containing protein [Oceanobacillus halotolerans]